MRARPRAPLPYTDRAVCGDSISTSPPPNVRPRAQRAHEGELRRRRPQTDAGDAGAPGTNVTRVALEASEVEFLAVPTGPGAFSPSLHVAKLASVRVTLDAAHRSSGSLYL